MSKLTVRRPTPSERRFLDEKLADRTLSACVLDRYRIVDALLREYNPSEAARFLGCERPTVYQWVYSYNESSFSDFEKASNPYGRPAILTSENLRQLVKIALSRPQDLGFPFAAWSVTKLSDCCRNRGLLPDVSNERIRRLLKREGLSVQRTKSWKRSPDPECEGRNRTLELYHRAPRGGAALCYDEWGPLELKPLHGQHWARTGHPTRLRATYRRLAGTEQFLGFYDVHRDCLAGTFHKRKTRRDLLAAFRTLRRAYPQRIRLYIIMDNLPLHKTAVLLRYFRKNRITPVWTPTYSSWLNLIECQFTSAKRFALDVSDDPDHETRRRRIYRYTRWRNRHVGSQRYTLAKVFNH